MAIIKYSAEDLLNDPSVMQEFINVVTEQLDGIVEDDTVADTYTLSATDGDGTVTLNLDATTGDDSSIVIEGGTDISVDYTDDKLTIAYTAGGDEGNYVEVDTTTGEITDGTNVFQYLYQYLHVRFSDTENGNDFVSDPATITGSNFYIGLANRSTTTNLTNNTDYNWTQYTWSSTHNVFYRMQGGNRINFLTSTQSSVGDAVEFVSGDSPLDLNSLMLNGGNFIDAAITTTKIADDAITTPKINTNAVTANEIAADTITASEIASNTITASKIASNTITASEIASNTITASEIASNAITADEISSNAVTTIKLNASAVTAAKIATNAITTDKIEAGAITSDKIEAGTIAADRIKLGTGYLVDDGSGNVILDDGSVDSDILATDAVASKNIATDAVTADSIAADSVTAAKINPAFGSLTIGDADTNVVQSGNFVADSDGWRIRGNGDAEFSNVNIRGNSTVDTTVIGGTALIPVTLDESSVSGNSDTINNRRIASSSTFNDTDTITGTVLGEYPNVVIPAEDGFELSFYPTDSDHVVDGGESNLTGSIDYTIKVIVEEEDGTFTDSDTVTSGTVNLSDITWEFDTFFGTSILSGSTNISWTNETSISIDADRTFKTVRYEFFTSSSDSANFGCNLAGNFPSPHSTLDKVSNAAAYLSAETATQYSGYAIGGRGFHVESQLLFRGSSTSVTDLGNLRDNLLAIVVTWDDEDADEETIATVPMIIPLVDGYDDYSNSNSSYTSTAVTVVNRNNEHVGVLEFNGVIAPTNTARNIYLRTTGQASVISNAAIREIWRKLV